MVMVAAPRTSLIAQCVPAKVETAEARYLRAQVLCQSPHLNVCNGSARIVPLWSEQKLAVSNAKTAIRMHFASALHLARSCLKNGPDEPVGLDCHSGNEPEKNTNLLCALSAARNPLPIRSGPSTRSFVAAAVLASSPHTGAE